MRTTMKTKYDNSEQLPNLYTIKDMAKILNISERNVSKMESNGNIPSAIRRKTDKGIIGWNKSKVDLWLSQ